MTASRFWFHLHLVLFEALCLVDALPPSVVCAQGERAPRLANARALLSHASDYTYMWWTHGLRDERKTFSIQTNRFAIQFDVPRLQLTHLLPIEDPPAMSDALAQRNADIFGSPNASLCFTLEANGRKYEATGASPRYENCQLIESGRFFQRRLIQGIRWQAGAPKTDTECEIAAWPDRLTLLLRVTPSNGLEDGALRIALRSKERWFVKADRPSATIATDADVWTARLDVGDWPAGEERTVAMIVQSDMADDASPAIAARQIAPAQAPLDVVYDHTMGWHRIALRNDPPAHTYDESSNNRIERVRLFLNNPSTTTRTARLNFAKGRPANGGVFGITGLSAILRDADGNPTGIPVQISKNWHAGRPRHARGDWKPGRYRGSWYRGLTMVTVPAKTAIELEYTSVNALWGGVPAASHAQLCLAGWGSNQLWEQAAIGSWGESLCFEPDQGQRGGAVLDTRPLMVSGLGNRPKRKWGWTCNVGGADFLVYYDREGRKQWNSRMKTLHQRNGPVLTEVTYAGRSQDSKIDLRSTVSLYRTDDITRGVYRFRYDVREPVTFSRLVLFQCGSDDYSYTGEREFARGGENGLVEEWQTEWGGNRYKTEPVELTGRIPWVSMHEAVPRAEGNEAWANRGIVIREWDARLGGRHVRPWAAERGAKVRGTDTSLVDILPPPDIDQLQVGDYVAAVVEHVVVPQFAHDYYGPNENLRAALKRWQDTWEMVHREAIGNDLAVNVVRGELLRDRPTMIRATENHAEFAITGGLGYVPITITGLTDFRQPLLEIQETNNGTWIPVDQAVHGNDFWQTDYDTQTGTWQVTYSVPMDTPGDKRVSRAFRFRIGSSTLFLNLNTSAFRRKRHQYDDALRSGSFLSKSLRKYVTRFPIAR